MVAKSASSLYTLQIHCASSILIEHKELLVMSKKCSLTRTEEWWRLYLGGLYLKNCEKCVPINLSHSICASWRGFGKISRLSLLRGCCFKYCNIILISSFILWGILSSMNLKKDNSKWEYLRRGVINCETNSSMQNLWWKSVIRKVPVSSFLCVWKLRVQVCGYWFLWLFN